MTECTMCQQQMEAGYSIICGNCRRWIESTDGRAWETMVKATAHVMRMYNKKTPQELEKIL